MPPRKKGKGVVAVLDVGRGVCDGTEPTFFTRAKQALIRFIQRKIFARLCHDQVGIVLFGTPETDNPLARDGSYRHVTVLRKLAGANWNAIDQVQSLKSGGSSGDWLDAVEVALDMLKNHDPAVGVQLVQHKIMVFTDFSGEFDESNCKRLTRGLLDNEVNLVVIGPEFAEEDAEENGDEPKVGSSHEGDIKAECPKESALNWNGKPKTVVQMAGEAVVTDMAAKCDGLLCSLDEAMSQLLFFEAETRNRTNWNVHLEIGPKLKIPISGRIMVQRAKPPTWKKFYREDKTQLISREVSYHLWDENQTEVPKEEVINGYRFGATLIPCSDEDMKRYSSNSPRCLSVLGFTSARRVPPQYWTGNQVLSVLPRANDVVGARVLSALAEALTRKDMVAITRRIYSHNAKPKMGALFAEVIQGRKRLLWIQLPFSHEVVPLAFPSLQPKIDKLKDEEGEFVSRFIDATTLKDEEDDDELNPREMPNPRLQHLYNCMAQRALNPDEPVAKPTPHILAILEPPKKVRKAQEEMAEKMKALFPLTPCPTTSKRNWNMSDVKEEPEDTGGKKPKLDGTLDPGDIPLVMDYNPTYVTSATPAKDFMTLLKKDPSHFADLCKQMEKVLLVIMDSLRWSVSTTMTQNTIDKVLESLEVFRRESCSTKPATYNAFIPELKKYASDHSLNAVWEKVKEGNLGLITNEESVQSTVGPEEAAAFFQEAAAAPATQDTPADDMHDMLDDF